MQVVAAVVLLFCQQPYQEQWPFDRTWWFVCEAGVRRSNCRPSAVLHSTYPHRTETSLGKVWELHKALVEASDLQCSSIFASGASHRATSSRLCPFESPAGSCCKVDAMNKATVAKARQELTLFHSLRTATHLPAAFLVNLQFEFHMVPTPLELLINSDSLG